MRSVIYFADGRFVRMAERSLQSLRRYIPDIHAVLNTTRGNSSSDFDKVFLHERGDELYLDKIQCLQDHIYEENLYLDADTLVVANPRCMFDLLDRFDFAAGHADVRQTKPGKWRPDIPDSFPEYHAGVMVYRGNDAVEDLFCKWNDSFRRFASEHPKHKRRLGHSDQVPLRAALWDSSARTATLTPEYVCRPYAGYLEDRLVILHWHSNLQRLADAYAGDGPRVHLGERVYQHD